MYPGFKPDEMALAAFVPSAVGAFPAVIVPLLGRDKVFNHTWCTETSYVFNGGFLAGACLVWTDATFVGTGG